MKRHTACRAAANDAGGLPTVFEVKLNGCATALSIKLSSPLLVIPVGLYGERYTLEAESGDLCGGLVASRIEA